jgi:predicted glycoside hydrolase/deacetylase ChbG (UPF0249 family)
VANVREGRRIIINADDYGYSSSANLAIDRTVSAGSVHSISVMTNMPCALEVVRFLEKHPRTVSIGLHLNLTCGYPIRGACEVGSLVDGSGMFYGKREFVQRIFAGKIKCTHLTLEIQSQIEKLVELVGVISHIDSHHHVHRFPQVFWGIMSTTQSAQIKRIRTNRRSLVSSRKIERPKWLLLLEHVTKVPMSMPGFILKAIQRNQYSRFGLLSPDSILTPVPPIPPGLSDHSLEAWDRTFYRLPLGTYEINCHPGKTPGEEDLFSSADFIHLTRKHSIQLISYGELQ